MDADEIEKALDEGKRRRRVEVDDGIVIGLSDRGMHEVAYLELECVDMAMVLEDNEWGVRPKEATAVLCALVLKMEEGRAPLQVLVNANDVDKVCRALQESKRKGLREMREVNRALANPKAKVEQVAKPRFAEDADIGVTH